MDKLPILIVMLFLIAFIIMLTGLDIFLLEPQKQKASQPITKQMKDLNFNGTKVAIVYCPENYTMTAYDQKTNNFVCSRGGLVSGVQTCDFYVGQLGLNRKINLVQDTVNYTNSVIAKETNRSIK